MDIGLELINLPELLDRCLNVADVLQICVFVVALPDNASPTQVFIEMPLDRNGYVVIDEDQDTATSTLQSPAAFEALSDLRSTFPQHSVRARIHVD